jgi:hypothetical protein
MIDGSDQDTIQGIAAHLARESGRTPAQCWEEALAIWRVRFARDVLALDEDRNVVNLGPIE